MIAMYKVVHDPARAAYRRRPWWKFWQKKQLVPGSIMLGVLRSDLVGLYHGWSEACAAMERLGDKEVWFEDVGESATGPVAPGPDPAAALRPPLSMRARTDRLDHAENSKPMVPKHA